MRSSFFVACVVKRNYGLRMWAQSASLLAVLTTVSLLSRAACESTDKTHAAAAELVYRAQQRARRVRALDPPTTQLLHAASAYATLQSARHIAPDATLCRLTGIDVAHLRSSLHRQVRSCVSVRRTKPDAPEPTGTATA